MLGAGTLVNALQGRRFRTQLGAERCHIGVPADSRWQVGGWAGHHRSATEHRLISRLLDQHQTQVSTAWSERRRICMVMQAQHSCSAVQDSRLQQARL